MNCTLKPHLIIFYQFDPWRSSIGGIQTFIRNFLKFVPENFKLSFVGTGSPKDKIGQWQVREYEGNSIHYLPVVSLENDDVREIIPTTLRYTFALRKYKFEADFLHFNRLEPSIVSRRWIGEKTYFIHNDIEKQLDPNVSPNAILWQAFPQLYLSLEKLLIPQFDYINSCNSNSVAFYRKRFPQLRDRIQLLNNTVDTEIFKPVTSEIKNRARVSLAKKLSLDHDTQFILFAGRLHPQKDPVLLLQALKKLNRSRQHLLMAGEGELFDQVKAEVKSLGLEQHVSLLGAVDQLRLAELFQLSQMLVLSSAYEGLPLTALEALASGIPVVTTKSGDTPRVLIPGSGIVCSERTPDIIADAMHQIITNPENFPAETCVKAIEPYTARSIVSSVYDQMFIRWQSMLKN